MKTPVQSVRSSLRKLRLRSLVVGFSVIIIPVICLIGLSRLIASPTQKVAAQSTNNSLTEIPAVAAQLLQAVANAPALVPIFTPSENNNTQDGAEKPATSSMDPAWWQTVQEEIRQSEYHISWQEDISLPHEPAAYQAANRTHDFRTRFVPDGIRLQPRAETTIDWEWGLSLTSYGYAGHIQPVAVAELVPAENRIAYRRGQITEWYINDARGLEQGFVLQSAPAGAQPETRLQINLALLGNLKPSLAEDEQAVEFITSGGVRVLYYSALHAYDAAGQSLPAHMALAGCEAGQTAGDCFLQLVVDDREAVYPITIDPLATTPNWTAESDQATSQFGYAVATAGDVNGDGYSDVIVGAYGYDNGQTNEGRAFVYHGSAAGLSTTPNWTAEIDQANANFGIAVGTAGDVNGDGYDDVIVGASTYNNGQTNEGAAYVYHGATTGLSATADWTAEGNKALGYFGVSAGTAGDVNGDGYDDIIVGASNYYNNFDLFEGWAFVYHGSAAGLSLTPNWTAEGNLTYAYFGTSVGTAGDINGDSYDDVIVGAPGANNAYVYHGAASGLSSSAGWTASGVQAGDNFGVSVGTAGDVNGDSYDDIIVGAYFYNNGQTSEGAAFVYHGAATGLSTTIDWAAESNQASAFFGISVGTAGDINGDSYDDVIVGAYFYESSAAETNEGAAFAYYGAAAGLATTANWMAESNQANANLGISVGTAGDVNGDGYADVIVGANFYDNDQTDEGRVFVYQGQGAGAAPPIAAFSAAPLTGTAPLTVTFTNSSTNATNYLWQFGDGITTTVAAPSHVYTLGGVYTVTLSAVGAGGSDTLTRTHYITVTPPTPVTADFSAAITGPNTGTILTNYSFTASVMPITITTPLTYTWLADGHSAITNVNGASNSVSFAWNTAGRKNITVAISNDAGAITSTIAIDVADSSVVVEPSLDNMLFYSSSNGGFITITFPTGAVTATTTLLYTAVPTPTGNTSLSFAGHAFSLNAYRDGRLLSNFVFEQPITVTIQYVDGDVIGIGKDTLSLFYWNDSAWSTDGITLVSQDTANNNLTATITHLTEFAIFGQNYRVYLPAVVR